MELEKDVKDVINRSRDNMPYFPSYGRYHVDLKKYIYILKFGVKYYSVLCL